MTQTERILRHLQDYGEIDPHGGHHAVRHHAAGRTDMGLETGRLSHRNEDQNRQKPLRGGYPLGGLQVRRKKC